MKKAPSKGRSGPGDLYAEVHQSACDKLLDSTGYPLAVFERKDDFPGCSRMALQQSPDAFYEYKRSELKTLLREAVDYVRNSPERKDSSVYDDIYAFGGDIIEQAKKVLDAANGAGADYAGPGKDEMRKIVDGGIENLAETLGDWGAYAWCPYLRVTLKQRPRLTLASPRIDLRGVKIEVKVTGELWAKFPWWNCYKWCTKWERVIKCKRAASLTVSPDIAADAHASIESNGSLVVVRGEFDKLRLDYPILREIPLEGLANKKLRDKLVYVFDASKFVATVPVLGSKFSVDSISLPAMSNGIGVGVTIKQT